MIVTIAASSVGLPGYLGLARCIATTITDITGHHENCCWLSCSATSTTSSSDGSTGQHACYHSGLCWLCNGSSMLVFIQSRFCFHCFKWGFPYTTETAVSPAIWSIWLHKMFWGLSSHLNPHPPYMVGKGLSTGLVSPDSTLDSKYLVVVLPSYSGVLFGYQVDEFTHT